MMMAETLNFLQNLIPSDSQRHSKDIRYRLTLFLDFLASTNLSLDHPELLIRYRDYLLTERGFAASTVRSHLATIRKLIRTMLNDDALYQRLIDDGHSHREVDALLGRIYQAINTDEATVKVEASFTSNLNVNGSDMQAWLDHFSLNSPSELRNGALSCLEAVTGIREYELCALDVKHLRAKTDDGQLGLYVPDGYGCTKRTIPYGEESQVLKIVDTWLGVAGIQEGAVFRGFHAGQRIRKNRLSPRAVESILAQHPALVRGEPVVLKPLDLRHAYARHQYHMGVSKEAIQKNLGFKTLLPVIDYLGNALDEYAPSQPYQFDLSRLDYWEDYANE